jgi:DnaJ family protein C protein 28
MKPWEPLVEKKIREAMEQGEFDDLSGKGEPIDLAENPFEDPDWRMAHRMLRNAGFAPAWIEERKDIESEIEAARTTLARIWLVMQNAQHTKQSDSAQVRWRKALEDFRAKSCELNRRIETWNLKAPAVGLHRNWIDFDREIDRIKTNQRP